MVAEQSDSRRSGVGISPWTVRVWHVRVQVVWITFTTALASLALFRDGELKWPRREVLLAASALAVGVFAMITFTVLVARAERATTSRELLVVAFTAAIFVAGASGSLGVGVTAGVAALGVVHIGVVACLNDRQFRPGLASLTMIIGVPTIMSAAGLVVHASLVYVRGFDANVLFFPTTVCAFSGMTIGLSFDRLVDGGAATIRRRTRWRRGVLLAYLVLTAGMAFRFPHGWVTQPSGRVSLAIATLWAVVVFLPIYWSIRRRVVKSWDIQPVEIATSMLKSWWTVGLLAAGVGLVHAAVSVRLLRDDDAVGYDFTNSLTIETTTAVTVALSALGAVALLAKLAPLDDDRTSASPEGDAESRHQS